MVTRLLWVTFVGALLLASPGFAADRPNILWLTTEDIGPQLGCYGDTYADTPNLDRFAKSSLMYLNAWSNAPVCAPARTTIITGVYATSTGSQHMRSVVPMPTWMKMYPQILREAGYYCTNNSKEDYNLIKNGQVWDESSKKAHWKNRPANQPFFAVFNHLGTHESQIRIRPHQFIHDPAKAPLPAYHPDTIEVRQDWAQYYDNITVMDQWFAGMMKEVADAGLADDTIVFFYGDHGSGMPRSKRWPYNSGLQVPLLVHVPEKWKKLWSPEYTPGGKTDRLVSFVDLAPTLMSLIGVKPPEWIQGKAYLGMLAEKPRDYIYGYRGRMDERIDLVRSIRGKRYIYIRNFMPQRIYGQYLAYMWATPTTRVWKGLYDQGKLKPPQTYFWEKKPAEELYDLENDKDEVSNLANKPEYVGIQKKLASELNLWILATRDTGFLPEALMHSSSKGSTPYELAQQKTKYPLQSILRAADLASKSIGSDTDDGDGLEITLTTNRELEDTDPAVRYWAILTAECRGPKAGKALIQRKQFDQLMHDEEQPSVAVAASELMARYGEPVQVSEALKMLLKLANLNEKGVYCSWEALTAIDDLGPIAKPIHDQVAKLPKDNPAAKTPQSIKEEIPRLIEHITGEKSK